MNLVTYYEKELQDEYQDIKNISTVWCVCHGISVLKAFPTEWEAEEYCAQIEPFYIGDYAHEAYILVFQPGELYRSENLPYGWMTDRALVEVYCDF